MANLRLENVTKCFGQIEAVKNLTLDINDGEFFCILGPPGAGKTTTLRLIVGLERPDEGMVYLDGQPVNKLYPGQRDIAMIFQNLALYPHKTVYDNIAFPLRERKLPQSEIDALVKNAAKILHIERMLDRKPAKLSGGERQRVAIGRAIVRRPRAYLMDEPLSNLDAMLRLEMRVELKRLQRELGQTLVYVTHDQIEALSMADRIAVLNRGVLQQCDPPDTIYNLPANHFVATMVGSPPMNFVLCELRRAGEQPDLVHPAFRIEATAARQVVAQRDRVWLGMRPEDIRVFAEPPAEAAIPARVSVVEPLGSETIVDLALGSELIKVTVSPTQTLAEGQPVWVTFDPAKLHLFDPATDQRLYSSSRAEPLSTRRLAIGD
ncbi:MAG: ABC transporter ATP-binding protein [Chloroflexi bacterium]|nr:ABC transporter ATP-binding protein [Chloroflexota bacterium]